jgi:hypothetical protein
MQAPPREVTEWTQKDIGKHIVHIPVSSARCPLICDRMSHLSSSADCPENDELVMNFDAAVVAEK